MYGLMDPRTGLTQRVGYPQGSAVVQGGGAPTGSGVIDNVTVPPPPLPPLRSINTVTPEKPRQPKPDGGGVANLGMLYPTIFDMEGNADSFGGPGQMGAMNALGQQAMTGKAPAHIKPWGTEDQMKRAAHMRLQQMAAARPYSGLAAAIMGGESNAGPGFGGAPAAGGRGFGAGGGFGGFGGGSETGIY